MKRALIVDDNRSVRELTKAFVEHTNKFDSIEAVSSGEEALELFEPNKYYLIILDIGLQKISGAEVCFLMRQEDELVNIIALTGHAVGEDIKILAGFNEVFIKAMQYRELLDYIASV
jgi:CheY-like chemotaxis protein